MTFEEYHDETHKTAIYPKSEGITYTALGLGGEVGEVQGIVKKALRGDFKARSPEDVDKQKQIVVDKLTDELGDVFWYLSRLMHEAGISPGDVLEHNHKKLNKRKDENRIMSTEKRD